jgi:uncharacterized membrane protein
LAYHNPVNQATWPAKGFWAVFALRIFASLFAVLGVIAAFVIAKPAAQRDAILAFWARGQYGALHYNPEIFPQLPLSIQTHIVGVTAAIVIGVVILTLPKGTGLHRTIGWSWVTAMSVVAITSVWMVADVGGINPLHAFTAVTVVSLYVGLTGIRRGDVRRHAGAMMGLLLGGLLLAGVFAFIPGRTMWRMFFGT